MFVVVTNCICNMVHRKLAPGSLESLSTGFGYSCFVAQCVLLLEALSTCFLLAAHISDPEP